MGYGSARLLWQVELPLALPSIFTGLRIATVSTVALVTVGVIVGQGGLGQIIIVNGFGANYYRPPIVFGTLACVVLALVADQALALAPAAVDAVGADPGRGMNVFGDALVYLNDPVNWTRQRGILDLTGQHVRIALLALMIGCWSPCRSACGWGTPGAAVAPGRAGEHIRAVPTLAILAIFAVTRSGSHLGAGIALTVFASHRSSPTPTRVP